MNAVPVQETLSVVAPLLVGLAGGLHCVGMCGGIVGALSLSRPPSPLRHALAITLYHTGRISSYGILGLIFGLAGGMAEGAPIRMIQQGVTVVAGALMLLFALQVGGFMREWRIMSFVRLPTSPLKKAAEGSLLAWLVVGLTNGFLPCGLVYAALGMALASGGPFSGGLVMLLFGLGTIPALLGVAFAARLVNPARRGLALKGAAIIVALYGVWYMVKPIVMAGRMSHG